MTGLYYGLILRNYPVKRNSRIPWMPSGLPENSGDLPGPPLGPSRTPMDHASSHISTNFQRQKLSIAASESFRCNTSFRQWFPWTVLSCMLREQSPFQCPSTGMAQWIYPSDLALVPRLYIYIYISTSKGRFAVDQGFEYKEFVTWRCLGEFFGPPGSLCGPLGVLNFCVNACSNF